RNAPPPARAGRPDRWWSGQGRRDKDGSAARSELQTRLRSISDSIRKREKDLAARRPSAYRLSYPKVSAWRVMRQKDWLRLRLRASVSSPRAQDHQQAPMA